MTKEQALQILDQAVSQLNANRATHQQLMTAINVLRMSSVADVKTEKPEAKKDDKIASIANPKKS